jgi:hypothetical protein
MTRKINIPKNIINMIISYCSLLSNLNLIGKMKFGEIFEYHKIPEWYNMYLNYELFKQKIELFTLKKKLNEVIRLPGYYVRTSDGQLVQLDLTISKHDE